MRIAFVTDPQGIVLVEVNETVRFEPILISGVRNKRAIWRGKEYMS